MIQEPTPLTPIPAAAPRPAATGRKAGLKLGLLIAVLAMLAIPVVMAMASNSQSPAPQNALGAGATAVPTPDETGEPGDQPGHGNGNGFGFGLGKIKGFGNGNGHGPNGGAGRGPITISAVSGNQVSLATADGWTRTVTVTTTTVITKGGVKVAVGDLKQGDEVGFRETRKADGTYSIDAIDVVTPSAKGAVTKIDANDITITQPGGATRVITVTDSTVYKRGSAAASKADVKVGDDIQALGAVSGTTFTATSISIDLADAGGKVTAKTTGSITVLGGNGKSIVIHVTSSTTYEIRGQATAALAGIAVGDYIAAEGTLRSDGSLDAVSVQAGAPKGQHPSESPEPDSSDAPG
ncbi:MAG: hypothetical protein QOE66_984 [Chloroflexota bacterium]|nr:hypothetical protein [Chloroflexota bacterium]